MSRLCNNLKFIINYSLEGRAFKKSITASSYDSAVKIAYACCGQFTIDSVEVA